MIGANSEVVFGSMLVPEEINPREFSIAAIPGMVICARRGTGKSRKVTTIKPRLKNKSFFVMKLLTRAVTSAHKKRDVACVVRQFGFLSDGVGLDPKNG